MDKVAKEHHRIQMRLRRHGPQRTTDHVLDLMKSGRYPVTYPIELAERLLKNEEYAAAGRLLKAIKESGEQHALIDSFYAAWLWGIGAREDAIAFASKQAKHWNSSFLFLELSEFYEQVGKRRESKLNFDIAVSLAESENRAWLRKQKRRRQRKMKRNNSRW
jgi:hypothetical protein